MIANACQLVVDSMPDRKPVKVSEVMRDVRLSGKSQSHASSVIHSDLKFVKKRIRASKKKRIAIVKVSKNKGRN